MASSGRPKLSPRRHFTSTKTVSEPSRATISISSRPRRTFRASTTYPWRDRYPAAQDSPKAPRLADAIDRNRSEALTVDRGWTETTKGFEVLAGSVPLVSLKAVFWKTSGQGRHPGVASHFCDDRRGGYRKRLFVCLRERHLCVAAPL